ncbi:MAG: cytochrome c biogenesis protein CcsA [Planctomycetota bacterium]
MKSIARIGLALLLPALAAGTATAQGAGEAPTRPAWRPEVVKAFSQLGVMQNGRIQPLDTHAMWLLRRLNGSDTAKTADGRRLGAVEWYLDVLFWPEVAAHYPVFRVENDDVLTAVGLSFLDAQGLHTKNRFDRYAYEDLRPALGQLFRMSATVDQKRQQKKQIGELEGQINDLAHNIQEYEALAVHLDFARVKLAVPEVMRETLGASELSVAGLLGRIDKVQAFAAQAQRTGGAEGQKASDAIQALDRDLHAALGNSRMFPVMFPPSRPVAEQREWMTPWDIGQSLLGGLPASELETQVALLARLEAAVADRADADAVTEDLLGLASGLTALAERRGEAAMLASEATYNKAELIYRATLVFLFAFLVAAVGWLRPAGRWLPRISVALSLVGLALLIGDITWRCVLQERPPIKSLYETFPFITAVAVIGCLVIEWIGRRGVGLALAPFIGALGLMLARRYALISGQDTMQPLVAVLDTNFWLATHVTTINIGYAGGMLAGFLGAVYLLGRLVGFRRQDRAFYKGIVRMVYGVLCFGLMFSVVGTILGGIWANESWGRFWGWDPKENGALMICLYMAAILHGRLGGVLRDWGLCLAAVAGNMVVGFSWFGVNLLQVGLHSYGFDSRLQSALNIFYGIHVGIFGLGLLARWRDQRLAEGAQAGHGDGEPEHAGS